MIENWRDLVGYEEITAPVGKVFYLSTKYSDTDTSSTVGISIERGNVECMLTEDALCDELDRILTSFSTTCENNSVAIERAKLDSVRKMKRGFLIQSMRMHSITKVQPHMIRLLWLQALKASMGFTCIPSLMTMVL